MTNQTEMEKMKQENEGVSYKGTFVLVMLLGLFIIGAWAFTFYHFLIR